MINIICIVIKLDIMLKCELEVVFFNEKVFIWFVLNKIFVLFVNGCNCVSFLCFEIDGWLYILFL